MINFPSLNCPVQGPFSQGDLNPGFLTDLSSNDGASIIAPAPNKEFLINVLRVAI